MYLCNYLMRLKSNIAYEKTFTPDLNETLSSIDFKSYDKVFLLFIIVILNA